MEYTQRMNEFLQRLTLALEKADVVRVTIIKNDHGCESADTPVTGIVEEVCYKRAGEVRIRSTCGGFVADWGFSKRTPCLEVLSNSSYRLYNGGTWMTLDF